MNSAKEYFALVAQQAVKTQTAESLDVLTYVFRCAAKSQKPVFYGWQEFFILLAENVIVPYSSILEITLPSVVEDAVLIMHCMVTKTGFLKEIKTGRKYIPQEILEDNRYKYQWRLMNFNDQAHRLVN